jgi:hypothetical protein
MYYFGQQEFFVILKLWLIALAACSFLLGLFGLNAGHHHPDAAHEGDELP